MKQSIRFLLVISIAVLSLPGCEPKEKPVTKEQALEFASQLEQSIAKGSPDFFNNAFDVRTLASRMKNAEKMSTSEKAKHLRKSLKFGSELLATIDKTGSYRLLRSYEKDGKQHLLFRLYYDGTINYHNLELINARGKCKIADIYMYMSGENISESMADVLRAMFAEVGDGRISDTEKAWINSMPTIKNRMRAGAYKEAKELIDRLPANVRKQKGLQILSIQAAMELDAETLVAAVDEYKNLYPGDPNIPILMMSVYGAKGEYAKYREAVDELDRQVEKDPVLEHFRAGAYFLEGEEVKGRACIERLLKEIPDFPDAMLEIASSWLRASEYEKAKFYIDKLRANRDFDQSLVDELVIAYPGYQQLYEPDDK